MSVVAGDLALLARLQDLFLAPNVSGEGSATKGVRRKVQIQVGEILRHVANENDGDLLSTLLDSVAADPVDHGRNEVLVRLLRPRDGEVGVGEIAEADAKAARAAAKIQK